MPESIDSRWKETSMLNRTIPIVPIEETEYLNEGLQINSNPSIEFYTSTKFYIRFWYLISNPFRYLFFGKIKL